MKPVPKSYAFLDQAPQIHESCFIAANATVIGDVSIGENSSVWYQCVLRGDINRIVIGSNTNIQDGTVVHLADKFGTTVGDWVTVGHKALLHACTIEDEVLIGMAAIVMDGAVIGKRSIVGHPRNGHPAGIPCDGLARKSETNTCRRRTIRP